ncbi:MAG: hypothetical protein CM1200mP15_15500 [Dehalococcoidia bacterium]|nr:MAG: hypothetical protein CM1200mP15_15500 [Dehalococcoidia bacterium]
MAYKERYYDDETNLISTVVDQLVAGKVIGWFQGRGEWGPRALGNRSIIADPRTNTIKDTINEKIKFREPFRPFAPSVLAEAADQYFDLADLNQSMASNFMLMVVPGAGCQTTGDSRSLPSRYFKNPDSG